MWELEYIFRWEDILWWALAVVVILVGLLVSTLVIMLIVGLLTAGGAEDQGQEIILTEPCLDGEMVIVQAPRFPPVVFACWGADGWVRVEVKQPERRKMVPGVGAFLEDRDGGK